MGDNERGTSFELDANPKPSHTSTIGTLLGTLSTYEHALSLSEARTSKHLIKAFACLLKMCQLSLRIHQLPLTFTTHGCVSEMF